MASTRIYYKSFGGGEVSPDMFGRIDDPQYQAGAALMENFIARPQGMAENRPGFEMVAAVKDSTKVTRVIPFSYSTTQTMVIEVGAGYFRFHTQGQTLLLSSSTGVAWSSATAYVPGNVVISGGNAYYCIANSTANTPPNTTYWYPMLGYGLPYEIPNPYAEADLMDLHYVQSNDVLTIVHPNYAPRELRRYGANNWVLSVISFASTLSAPASVTATANKGTGVNITNITVSAAGTSAVFTLANDVQAKQLATGQSIYITGVTGMTNVNNKYYIIDVFPSASTMKLVYYQTAVLVDTNGYPAYTGGGLVQAMTPTADITNYYVVTSYNPKTEGESAQSTAGSVLNNLYVNGAYNTITWPAVSGATRYRVYKRQNNLYGYIGQTDTTSFVDDNIAPDLGITPPVYETVFNSANNYPGAVSYFEQRRIFAGTNNEPQKIWMTRSGTESDMSYSIPTKDDDRISISAAAREANTIRHIVPINQLVMLTNSAEWRVSPVNSDVITPASVSVRPQSYVGANNVQPIIVNNSVVYCANRGGHIRELGYSWQSSGFVTGDLSLRANHLFDNKTIVDAAFAKAPQQIIWFISSDGKLLGLSYVPEQQIGSWHQHTTTGVFESCAVVSEGTEDALYTVVRRTMDGTEYRFIERLRTRQVTDRRQMVFCDHAYRVTSRNILTSDPSVCILSLGSSEVVWDETTLLTMYSSNISTNGVKFVQAFQPSPGLSTASSTPVRLCGVGNIVTMYTDDGTEYRFEIINYINDSTATVRPQQRVPTSLYGGTSNWGVCFTAVQLATEFSPADDLSLLIDGAPATNGYTYNGVAKILQLDHPSCDLVYGLRYNCNLQTLPAVMQIDGYGQGRAKNVNRVWLKLVRSSGVFVGPDADNLTEIKNRTTEPYGVPVEAKTDEVLIVIPPSWQNSGQIYIRNTDPIPLAIVGMTAEIAIGG